MKPFNWAPFFLGLLLLGCDDNESNLSRDVLITNVNLIDGTGADLQLVMASFWQAIRCIHSAF